MAEPARKHQSATYADIEKLPENVVGELIDGELYVQPRPAIPHAVVASGLGSLIGGPFHFDPTGPGGWVILYEPELHFERNVLVPDLASWRRTRMPTIPPAAFISLAPDWVCEVLSPGTEALDRSKKMAIYRNEGVSWIWFINPIHQTLEIFQEDGSNWKLLHVFTGTEKVRAQPFDAIELDLSRLWIS